MYIHFINKESVEITPEEVTDLLEQLEEEPAFIVIKDIRKNPFVIKVSQILYIQ